MAVLFAAGGRRAFLSVLVPVLMFLPADFYLRIKHLPPLNFADTAFLSLGIYLVVMELPRWRFSRLDLWVTLFIFTSCYSERLNWGVNGAFLHLITTILECLVPYMLGKLLVEQPGMRVEIVKRLVILLAVASVLAMPQFFLKWNLYIHFWSHFFPGQFPEFPQIRRGFGRVGGPYGGAEQTGMVLLIGLLLALWLKYCKNQWPKAVEYPTFFFEHSRIIIFILAATLLMTQSRGPWIGAIVALAVASIGSAERPARRAIIVFSVGLLVGVPLYYFGKDYVSGTSTDYGTERQTAQYRAELIENYVPLAKQGGAWGWGTVTPVVRGQASIDNEYLFIWLTQGYVGLGSLMLIAIEASLAFVRLGIMTRSSQERHFIYTLFGILIGLGVCLGTVWMNLQTYIIFFLIVGWSQSIRPTELAYRPPAGARTIRRPLQTVAIFT